MEDPVETLTKGLLEIISVSEAIGLPPEAVVKEVKHFLGDVLMELRKET